MKFDQETNTAFSLYREWESLNKKAIREGAPTSEANYYARMAASTRGRINWKLIDNPRRARKKFETKEYIEE